MSEQHMGAANELRCSENLHGGGRERAGAGGRKVDGADRSRGCGGVRPDRRTGGWQDDGVQERGRRGRGRVRDRAGLSDLRRRSRVAWRHLVSGRARRVPRRHGGRADAPRRGPKKARRPGTPALSAVVPVGRLAGGERQGRVGEGLAGRDGRGGPPGSPVRTRHQGHSR